jgi:hypothetical protein
MNPIDKEFLVHRIAGHHNYTLIVRTDHFWLNDMEYPTNTMLQFGQESWGLVNNIDIYLFAPSYSIKL